MKQLTKIQLGIMNAGGILMLLTLLLYFLTPAMEAWITGGVVYLMTFIPFLFTLGACMFGCMQMLQRYEGRNLTLLRLRRMQLMGAILLILAGFAMLVPLYSIYYGHRNEWLVFLAIGSVLQTWTAFRIPNELKKEQ